MFYSWPTRWGAHDLTVSQKHRIIQMDGDLRNSPVQPPVQSRFNTTADQTTHGFIQLHLQNLQEWRWHNFLGSLFHRVTVFMMRKWFFISRKDLSYFNLCVIFPSLLPHTTIKGLDPPSWLSSHRHCQALLGPFSRLNKLAQVLVSSSACCLPLPRTFQQSCYPARLSPAWPSEKASPFPGAGHLYSWNFKQLLLACCSSLPRFLWTAAQFWGTSAVSWVWDHPQILQKQASWPPVHHW